MSEPFRGSVEIITHDDQSLGVAGRQWTVDAVPVVLQTLHGITELTSVEPQPHPIGADPENQSLPEAQWEGVSAGNQPVSVVLRRDVSFSDTEIGRAMAQALGETQDG